LSESGILREEEPLSMLQRALGMINGTRPYKRMVCRVQKRGCGNALLPFQMVVDAEPSGSYLANQARDRILQIREGRKDIE
jgi:hypothetical protein